jgi:diguanylate cyclase (GGDEF)-like protein
MDLDQFKEVNDTLGHHSGDLLLREVGARLRAMLRETDTVARLGGDEFGVLLPDVADLGDVIATAEKLLEELTKPFLLDGLPVEVTASVGIAAYPDHGENGVSLLQRADVAMYVTKESRCGVSTYQADQDGYSRDRLSLFGDLRRAIDEGELVLHYQPKVDLRTDEVCGAEALVRWVHPERGLVPPDEFIPVAERTGLIRALSCWVLRTAAVQCDTWRRAGLDLSVAVNLSARDLHDTALPDEVARLLATLSLPASALELEITESTIMADPVRAMEVVRRLHDMGVRLAIDDFGTGYSSLAYLKRLPVHDIKIDKSFVTEMDADEHDLAIVRSTIELARNLGLEVVAEGVETDAALQQLSELGCHRAQGYLIARPAPAEVFTAWMEARHSAAAAAGLAELRSAR